MPVDLETPVQSIKGVGPRRSEMFERAGIMTVGDLVRYRPFRYEDRTNFQEIAGLRSEEEVVVRGTVQHPGKLRMRRKGLTVFELVIADNSGSIPVRFFNQPYLSQVFRKEQEVILFGTPRHDSYSSAVTFQNPEFELISAGENQIIHSGRITPVYRRIEKLTTRVLRQLIHLSLGALGADQHDSLPSEIRSRWNFPDFSEALRELHFPELPAKKSNQEFLEALNEFSTPAQRRFVFEEFFLFQLGLYMARRRRELIPKRRKIVLGSSVRNRVKTILPFHPTAAQKRVLKEILGDICGDRVMSRLLQGDVGSGKTIVALQAMVVVIENGFQAALMAPTELLAEQHLRNMQKYLRETPYHLALLSRRTKGEERRRVLSRVKSGEVQLVVGTHALIQEKVAFQNLGIVVVDEQHRFGVIQRSELMKKGDLPDTLVMTATPIPRSLAMTVYGDLRVSVLDELPPGRKPVKTVVKTESSRDEVYSVLRRQVKEGRQAYIVYPLIEESEKLELRSAVDMAEQLQTEVFGDVNVGLMHGRLPSAEKDELMRQFAKGHLQILVSTTVIEVGIDVPNATVMVIEHAERFGLSQLHQLRGRIGRGEHGGMCILMVDKVASRDAYERLDIMRRTNDGFKIAEKDLEIRGPGEFLGTRQSGVPVFHFGNIVRDREILELARREAESFFDRVSSGNDEKQKAKLGRLINAWRKRHGLIRVG
ncbi:MAG TPA: ATP-dependent DNA helicase RecG [Acidobacteriota bacterium]|nr:ATP-dependent DNA helicase RecG [Acidobacteriota bacterium]